MNDQQPPEDRAQRARSHALEVLEWRVVTQALAERCASASAARVAAALAPDLSIEAARRSLAETDEVLRLMEEGGLPVTGVRDVEVAIDLARRGGMLEPSALGDVGRTVLALAQLRERLDDVRDVAPLLFEQAAALRAIDLRIARAVETAIDERGHVRDDATPHLADLHRRRAQLAGRIESRLDQMRRDPDVADALTDDYITLRDDRLVLPVRTDRRQRVPGILHGRSQSGHSVFVEPAEIVDLNNELRSIALDIEEEVARILRELSLAVGRDAPHLVEALAAHRTVDLAVARASLSRIIEATSPQIDEGGALDLRALAHPRLLLIAQGIARRSIVRNDVRLEPPILGIVISGPNTGGKTVLLKAVGLACLMARAGLPIACEEGSRVPWLSTVLADIGDEQSLERSLSSFSGHVARLRDILAACDEAHDRALVLVDEIMAGTDPAEGAPLAQSVLEAIAARGARVIVTTHLGRLKAFAAEHPLFENAGMEFDERTLRPTWRMRLGIPGASAALMVADQLGLDAHVVARARELAGSQQVSVEALLRDLDAAREEIERSRFEASKARAESERLRADLAARLEELRRADAAHLREERAALDREIRALREEAARVTRDLQQRPSLAAAAETVQQLEALREKSRSIGAAADAAAVATRAVELVRGARIHARSFGKSGVVVDPPDARGRVRVQLGALTLQVDAEDLEADAGQAAKPKVAQRRSPKEDAFRDSDRDGSAPAVPFTPQSPRNTCDVRGQRATDALSLVSRFLEQARSTGERHVIVIHGHGTGALRQAVREELRNESRVTAFRPGGNGEGGDGVTVATLA